MDTIDTVAVTCKGSIKIVKYNKPKRKNALDVNMYKQIIKLLKEAANDDQVSVLVLTGSGDYYSSGNDLLASMEIDRSEMNATLKEYIDTFITFPKLLIAIVNGPAIGIAVTTLALCDLVFAAENSFFYTPFTKLGIVAEGSSTFTFPRLMGDRKAAEMLLYNHRMSAQEAKETGFVNYLYKPEEIQSKVWDKIEEVSKLSLPSITASKRLLRRKVQDEMRQANEIELKELTNVIASGDYLNSIMDFMNKKSKM